VPDRGVANIVKSARIETGAGWHLLCSSSKRRAKTDAALESRSQFLAHRPSSGWSHVPRGQPTSSWQYLGEEAGLSRIYGGIHYPSDERAGNQMGQGIGAVAVQRDRFNR